MHAGILRACEGMSAKGFAVTYGQPNVYHDTVVIPEEDAAEEVAMIRFEKQFYDTAGHALIHAFGHDPASMKASDMYDELAELIEKDSESPFKELVPALELAADMYDDETGV